MAAEVVKDDASIVLVGSFNPTIFHPSWLSANGLLTEQQTSAASNVNIIHAQIAQFSAGYLHFEVIPERAIIRGESMYLGYISDMAQRIFGDVLPHVPIYQVGLNRHFIVAFSDDAERSVFGRKIAPADPWVHWGLNVQSDDSAPPTTHGGLMRMTMKESPRPDGRPGFNQVDVQAVADSAKNVMFDINQHFDLGREAGQGADKALEILRTFWDQAQDRNLALIDNIRGAFDVDD